MSIIKKKWGNRMKKMPLVLSFILFAVIFSGMLVIDNQLFAQYPPRPTGCCKQRDWLAGEWYKTRLGFADCEELNRNRDNLDDIFVERGYVWWDANCNL